MPPSIHSIGIEWDRTNDTDHDAAAAVEYRVFGTTAWRRALPLVRVDFNGSNMLAGSLLFLAPDTTSSRSCSIRARGRTAAWATTTGSG